MDHLLTKVNQDQENGLIPSTVNGFCQVSMVPVMATPVTARVAYYVIRAAVRTQRGAEVELF